MPTILLGMATSTVTLALVSQLLTQLRIIVLAVLPPYPTANRQIRAVSDVNHFVCDSAYFTANPHLGLAYTVYTQYTSVYVCFIVYTVNESRDRSFVMVYAVVNRKGGTGKTTSAIALAHGVSKRARKMGDTSDFVALVIDLDPQGHTGRALGIEPGGRCISKLLLGEAGLRDVIMPASTAEYERPGLWIIPASDGLADAKKAIIAEAAMAEVMAKFGSKRDVSDPDTVLSQHLAPLKKAFKYIFLDCPPTLDSLQKAVYDFADEVIVPVKTDYLGMSGTVQHTQNILDEQAGGIDISIRGIIPTFVDTRASQTVRVLEALAKTYGRSRIFQPIPHTVKLAEAPEFGMTIFEYAASTGDKYAHMAAQAYGRIVEAIA